MGKKPHVKNLDKGDFQVELKTSYTVMLKDLNFRNALIYEV